MRVTSVAIAATLTLVCVSTSLHGQRPDDQIDARSMQLLAQGKAAKQPLGEATNAGKAKGRAIEETYKKLSQLEHILLRPDTYVGSVEKQQAMLWVHDGGEGFTQRQVTYVPGLYKIFDEIIVNAADNKMRDDSMDGFKVSDARREQQAGGSRAPR